MAILIYLFLHKKQKKTAMENLQPVLYGGNLTATDLDLFLSESSNSYLLYLGPALIERINCSPERLDYKMLVGRLYNAGWKISQIKQAFGHDSRTIKKWAEALNSDDMDFIVRAFSGRGFFKKLGPPAIRYVKKRYLELKGSVRNYRKIISAEVIFIFQTKLSRETLRQLFREADKTQLAAVYESSEKVNNKSNACHSDKESCSDFGLNDKQSTQKTPLGSLPAALDSSVQSPSAVQHAGMIFFTAMLEIVCRGGDATVIQSQWLSQILQGAVNIEQSRKITLDDLGKFCGGMQTVYKAQHRQLHALAGLDKVIDIYRANAELLDDGPGKDDVFYYDPTSKEYTGKHAILKGWCGSTHSIVKLMYLDAIHTRSGRPCFIQHYTPYYDLRERVFMSFAVFDKLFPEDKRSGRSFILDRGIFGKETFDRFVDSGDYLITWEKNYLGDGWDGNAPSIDFTKTRQRNNTADLKIYSFKCQEYIWSKQDKFRRIIVQAVNHLGREIQLSILCSNPSMPVEELVWLMFNRWVQENNFKYLNAHFGLNQLTSYANKGFDEVAENYSDKNVDSIEYREIKSSLRKVENNWSKTLFKREKQELKLQEAQKESVTFEKQMNKFIKKTTETLADDPINKLTLEDFSDLKKQCRSHKQGKNKMMQKLQRIEAKVTLLSLDIEHYKEEYAQIEASLSSALRKQSKLTLLIDNHYRILDTKAKAMMDALRITASNMFASLVDDFRPIYGNHRNDHVMLRQLSRSDGFVKNTERNTEIQLWLKGHYQKKQLEVFREFIGVIQNKINDHFGSTIKPLIITVDSKAPIW